MFPARKNKNTRGQNRPMVFAAVASANAERDSLFRLGGVDGFDQDEGECERHE
jgi:hypothetical protein